MYLGDNKFRNMRTGQEGYVSDEAAKNTFRISVEGTALYYENPEIENLIRSLGLKFDISEWGIGDR